MNFNPAHKYGQEFFFSAGTEYSEIAEELKEAIRESAKANLPAGISYSILDMGDRSDELGLKTTRIYAWYYAPKPFIPPNKGVIVENGIT